MLNPAVVRPRLYPDEDDSRRSFDRPYDQWCGSFGTGESDRQHRCRKEGGLDLVEFPSYKFLPYHVGMNIVDTVIKDGVLYII